MSITLEPEFYTAAFVSPLHLHQQRRGYERLCGECFFTLGMLAVALMQCLTVFGMASYLAEKDSGYMDEFKLGAGLFATGGATLSSRHAHDLCGAFNHIGLNQLTGVNTLTMPDGTSFEGTSDMPVFHSYKMPSGSWTFHSIGGDDSYIDKQMRVVHDPSYWNIVDVFPDFRVEYGVLLVIMVGWLWYHVLHELRKILKVAFVLNHLHSKGFVTDSKETTRLDADTGTITITRLTLNAFLVGYLTVAMRAIVALMMLVWGTSLLTASWNKLSLVLNSLAIGIVFELDVIIAYAVIDHTTMQRIENIEPVTVTTLRGVLDWRYSCDLLFSALLFLTVFAGALCVRAWQVDVHTHQLHNAAALCLFAGPTPHNLPDTVAPVPGFCESLLGLTCAPEVRGVGSHHGPCMISDTNIFHDESVMLYADDKHLFKGMYASNGTRRSVADWGAPSEKLTKTQTWQDDQNLNLFRRVCAQLYHPESKLDTRVIDPSLGLTMYSAPFYCPRDRIFQAVFGNLSRTSSKSDFNRWSSKFNLKADDIVAALDHCHEPLPVSNTKPNRTKHRAHKLPEDSQAPAPAAADAPAPAVAPVPASSNLLRVGRHHAHHQVQHQKVHREVYHQTVQRSHKLRLGSAAARLR